jgi:hypothetical protein
MKLYQKTKEFFNKWYGAFLVFYATVLVRQLDRSIQCLGKLKVLNLSQPLIVFPAPPREPTLHDVMKQMDRKQVTMPYMPSWVASSLKDITQHPGYSGFQVTPDPMLANIENIPSFAINPCALKELNKEAVNQVAPVPTEVKKDNVREELDNAVCELEKLVNSLEKVGTKDDLKEIINFAKSPVNEELEPNEIKRLMDRTAQLKVINNTLKQYVNPTGGLSTTQIGRKIKRTRTGKVNAIKSSRKNLNNKDTKKVQERHANGKFKRSSRD